MKTKTTENTPQRRRFLSGIAIAAGGVAAAAAGLPVVGFLLAPFLRQPRESWRNVGEVEGFTVGETVEVSFNDVSSEPWAGVTARTAAWLRREDEKRFVAFSVNCTHLGCPVRWEAKAKLFMCPCHGGVYYADGSVAAGPPPRALEHYPVRVRGGQVEVNTQPIPIT